MNRGCRSLWSLATPWGLHTWMAGLLVAGFLGCGGDRRSGAVPADSSPPTNGDASNTVTGDTAASPAPDTGGSAARPESTVTRIDTTKIVATKPAPRKPSPPKPVAPAKPVPPTAAPRPDSSATAPQPAETTAAAPTQTAEANAPLRDQYHAAPLDTVPQQVYDGWKQFNLNCARCHGEDVQGTTIAPHLIVSLKPEGPVNTKELFVQIVCAGRPAKGMPAWCALGMEMPTIEAIYSYVKGRSDAKIHPGRPAVKAGG